MDSMKLPSQRKRVQFSYDEPEPDDDAPRQKRPRFPKGKKGSQGEVGQIFEVDGEEEEGPVKATDPRLAAKERSVRRNQFTEQLLHSEETALLNDVTGAEEEYEDDVDEEEDGIILEPFNLKQEREEGFFDAEGNYVEYRNDSETKDAWLESTTVDAGLAEKHLKRYAEEEQGDTDLSPDDLAVIKRRITNALEAGETVLQALRRLKGSSTEKDRNHKMKMPAQTKALFDQLTEDAMKLLDNGDYNVYHEKKETFQREAEGYESLLRTRAGLSVRGSSAGASVNDNSSRHNVNIFSDDEDDSTGAATDHFHVTSGKVMATQVVDGPSRTSENHAHLRLIGRDERGISTDMFGENNEDNDLIGEGNEPSSASGLSYAGNKSTESSGGVVGGGSDYVFDESSGYYYNSMMGYYYDPYSGLFCSATSGKWYKFEEETNMYVEVGGESTNTVEPVKVGQLLN